MINMFCNRVAFSIGGTDIYWYGIIMAFSILSAFGIVLFLCKKKGVSTDYAFLMLFAAVVPAILCARLFSVLFEEGSSISEYFNFREGGMSIIGAVVGGAAGIAILALVTKKNFFVIGDLVAPVLIWGQAVGRWGNFANQEVYGRQILDKTMQWFPYAVEIDGNWYHALFFYESMLSFIGFAFLVTLLLKTKKKGIVTGAYLVYYGIVRTIMEEMREPEFILKFKNVAISKVFSIVMIVVGSAILITDLVLFIKNDLDKEKLRIRKLERKAKSDERKKLREQSKTK